MFKLQRNHICPYSMGWRVGQDRVRGHISPRDGITVTTRGITKGRGAQVSYEYRWLGSRASDGYPLFDLLRICCIQHRQRILPTLHGLHIVRQRHRWVDMPRPASPPARLPRHALAQGADKAVAGAMMADKGISLSPASVFVMSVVVPSRS